MFPAGQTYYAETVSLDIPGMRLNGRAAVRDQFVRPFIAGFPGNRHINEEHVIRQRPRLRRMELRS